MKTKNKQAFELYKSLRDELSTSPKGFEKELFFAFTDEQYKKGVDNLPEDVKEMKVYSLGAGCFGTGRAIKALTERNNNIYLRIKTDCDAQEVYYYEYNNYECCIDWDGDSKAIYRVLLYFGNDVARRIKRRRAFYTIEEVRKREEE